MFIVETQFIYGWENVWTEYDENMNECPTTFNTREEAQAGIDGFFADLAEDNMLDDYSRDDYRIVEVR